MLGVSTAAQLAERGAAVTLITDGALASGASGRSLSWLNSAAPSRQAASPPSDITADEAEAGRDHVVVLSDAFWRNQFAADRAIVWSDIRMKR